MTLSVDDDVMKVRVLLVDDSPTCVAMVSSILKFFNYEVDAKTCPLEALSAIRMSNGAYDMIISDVYMPLMTGLELQNIVKEEFQIPVILMSADDKRKLMQKGLETGATYFIVKPPSLVELKNIWQYVVSIRKNTVASSDANDVGRSDHNELHNINDSNNKEKDNDAARSTPNELQVISGSNPKVNIIINPQPMNTDQLQLGNSEGQNLVNEGGESNENAEGSSSSNKPIVRGRMVWTSFLHAKFMEAINALGPRAVPKKIMEYMNIPGVTRAHIASHLQKYRIYERKLQQSDGSMPSSLPMNWNESPFKSSFTWSQFPTLSNNSYLLQYSTALSQSNQQKLRSNYSICGKEAGQSSSKLANPQSDREGAIMRFPNPEPPSKFIQFDRNKSNNYAQTNQIQRGLVSVGGGISSTFQQGTRLDGLQNDHVNVSNDYMAQTHSLVPGEGTRHLDGSFNDIIYGNIQPSRTTHPGIAHDQFEQATINNQETICNPNNFSTNQQGGMCNFTSLIGDGQGVTTMPYLGSIEANATNPSNINVGTQHALTVPTMNQQLILPNNGANTSASANLNALYNMATISNTDPMVIASNENPPSQQGIYDQEMPTIDHSRISAIPLQDWALHNTNKDGLDDLSAVVQTFDYHNVGINNQLP